MQPENKSRLPLVISIVFLVLVVAAGIWYGTSKRPTNLQQPPTQSQLYPKPNDVIHILGGTVDKVFGAAIFIKVVDPNDYLPHPDGTPRRTQLRAATVLPSATLQLTNTKTGAVSAITLSDIRSGDAINVESPDNIKDANRFDVSKVALVR